MPTELKRKRNGVLSAGYFNAIGLPGVQAIDENGDDIDDYPLNRNQISFDGDARQLVWPGDFIYVNDAKEVIIRLKNTDGSIHERKIGDLGLDAATEQWVQDNFVAFSSANSINLDRRLRLKNDSLPLGYARTAENLSVDFNLFSNAFWIRVFPNSEFDTDNFSKFSFFANGDFEIPGNISKSSGSFKIDHPLQDKKDTHFLVHSFMESPQADLVYTGRVTLDSDGEANVDMNEASGMTAGTFGVLCKNIRRFTTNETGFSNVRSSFDESTSVLHIESESKEEDEINWMIVGQRKDPAIMASGLTDDDGQVIVEKPKEEEEEEQE